jgi:hypothetical protein
MFFSSSNKQTIGIFKRHTMLLHTNNRQFLLIVLQHKTLTLPLLK